MLRGEARRAWLPSVAVLPSLPALASLPDLPLSFTCRETATLSATFCCSFLPLAGLRGCPVEGGAAARQISVSASDTSLPASRSDCWMSARPLCLRCRAEGRRAELGGGAVPRGEGEVGPGQWGSSELRSGVQWSNGS